MDLTRSGKNWKSPILIGMAGSFRECSVRVPTIHLFKHVVEAQAMPKSRTRVSSRFLPALNMHSTFREQSNP